MIRRTQAHDITFRVTVFRDSCCAENITSPPQYTVVQGYQGKRSYAVSYLGRCNKKSEALAEAHPTQ